MPLIDESELAADFADAAAAVFNAYVDGVRAHPATPARSGRLRSGIEITSRSIAWPRAEATVASTATDNGVDYPAIIDQASGKEIEPSFFTKGSGPKALASSDGWGPYRRAKQSTKHRGWWDSANAPTVWQGALTRLGRFGW